MFKCLITIANYIGAESDEIIYCFYLQHLCFLSPHIRPQTLSYFLINGIHIIYNNRIFIKQLLARVNEPRN